MEEIHKHITTIREHAQKLFDGPFAHLEKQDAVNLYLTLAQSLEKICESIEEIREHIKTLENNIDNRRDYDSSTGI